MEIHRFNRLITGGVLLLLALLISVGSAGADENRLTDTQFQRKLQEAERLLRRGDADRAKRIYSDLYGRRPENRSAFVGVVSARVQAYDLEGLVEFVEARMAANPKDWGVGLLLGDVHATAGRPETAVREWKRVLPLVPDIKVGYREIARRMEGRRMIPDAVAILMEGRALLGDPFLYAVELVGLYSLSGNGEASAVECIRAVASGGMKSVEGLRHLRDLKENETISSYPLEEMAALLDSLPSLHGMREILAECYMEEGLCRKAYREFEELERIDPRCGNYLLPFARSAHRRNCNDDAVRALTHLVERCDRPSIRLEALFLLADVHRSAGSPDLAVDIYREITGQARNVREIRAARYNQAIVLLDEMGDAEEAIEVLQLLLRNDSGGEWNEEGGFALARAFRVAGRFDESTALYQNLEKTAQNDETRERAIYGGGMCLVFAGNVGDALTEYRRIIDQYPMGNFLNDALEQSIFLSDHRDAGDGALREYTECLRLIERHRFGEARGKADSLLESIAVSNLRDDLVWQLAVIDEEEGHYREANTVLEGLIAEFPEARLAHRARMKIGDILCRRLGDLPAGIAQYEKFLIDYPASILTEEVLRKRREAESERGS